MSELNTKLSFTEQELKSIHKKSLIFKREKINELKKRIDLGGKLTPLEISILKQWKPRKTRSRRWMKKNC